MNGLTPHADTNTAIRTGVGAKAEPFFRSWGMIGSVLMAMAIMAALVRWQGLAWPTILQAAFLDYERLVHFLFYRVVPASWPGWAIDLVNIYFWAAVAVYLTGFSRWGPKTHNSTISKIGWQALDIAASAVWPITLLGVLLLGTIAAFALQYMMTLFAEFVIAFAAAVHGKDRSEFAANPLPRGRGAFALVTGYVFRTVVWEFARTAVVLAAFLIATAVLNAATSNLPVDVPNAHAG